MATKRYTSDTIARAWACQASESGRCPSATTFDGPKFYSYRTCIAELVEHDGKRAYFVSVDRYSPSTGRHLNEIESALGRHASNIFTVPGVAIGCDNLADFPRIFRSWQDHANHQLKAAETSREPKTSRLLVEAYETVCKMRALAKFFHIALDEYPVTLRVPDKKRVSAEDYTGIIALKHLDPSPWMRSPLASAASPVDALWSLAAMKRETVHA